MASSGAGDDPQWYTDYLRQSAPAYRPGPDVAGAQADDVEGYIRRAASQRGIDPDVAIRVAQSEGGLVPNRTGSFSTGKSFWPFQLHYGGAGTPYAAYGTVAGMGNTFTQQTGWQPGDPNAWRAATDYALDQAKQSGWGQWYGARNQGITGFTGINRNAAAAPSRAAPSPEVGDDPAWYRAYVAQQGPQGGSSAQAAGDEGDPQWYRAALAAGIVGAGTASRAGSVPPAQHQGGASSEGEVWPVAGQKWGQVNNPFGGTQSRAAGTTVQLPSSNVGADLTGRYGAEVVAPVSGTVVEVFDAPNETDRNLNHGWGGMTLLRGDNGYTYRLSHAKPGSIGVRPGQRVQAGQYLQQIGVSGNTTGPHLDAEKFDRPGHFVDITAGSGGTVAASSGGASGGDDPAWYRAFMQGLQRRAG